MDAEMRSQAPAPRWFSTAYAAWRTRTQPRHAYAMDIDQIEVAGTEPYLFKELKQIPRDLMQAIVRRDPSSALNDEIFGRLGRWQAMTLFNTMKSEKQGAIVVFYDAGMTAVGPFWISRIWDRPGKPASDQDLIFSPMSEARAAWMELAVGMRLPGPLRDTIHFCEDPGHIGERFMPPETWGQMLVDIRRTWIRYGTLHPDTNPRES